MKNKTTTYKWAYLPFVFSSAAILATQVTAAPTGQHYQDAKQVNSINHEYVGGNSQIGFGVDDEGNVDVEGNFGISSSDNHKTGIGLWAGYDLLGDNKGILGRGGQVNHAWVSRDASGRATHVNKTFAAYDRNEAGHDKATIGYGQENEHLFWDGRVSKGLSGGKNRRTVGSGSNSKVVTDRAYDWGVGATVGKFLPNANARIRAGIDHEWSNKVGSGEKDARNTTLSAGIEKFFHGTGHSLSVDVAGSKNSGGYRFNGQDDTDVTGRLGYKYDFGGASIYQPDRRYRRVRVEVPGQAVAPRYAQKQQYKKVPTYKSVPVYGNKTVRTPYKQLVKSTMALEGQTFFKMNSAKLIPSAQTRLKQIASQIRKTGYKGSIRITGNTCGLGNARYDQILSERRAKEVRNFLIKNGFNPNHLIARGLGKGHPKYPRTPDQDFKNRRVDIEYVTEQKAYKTAYKTENKRVQTGTRRVATGFKNVPAGMKNVMVSNGRPGAPRVIWKTEAIPTSPAWIKRALNNNIQHNRTVNTYTTTFGNEGPNTPENIGPVATNDSIKTECGAPVSINVLSNDTDADGDALTITNIIQPANGVVTRGAGGNLIYTPNSTTACGMDDTFSYTISDGNGGTDTATVTVAVEEGVKAANDSATTPAGESVTIDVLANDDNDAEITRIVTMPSNGTAVISNGQVIYTPEEGFTGTDTFVYEVKDPDGNIATATATITVTAPVNNAPVANDDSTLTNQGQSVSLNSLSNDTDLDGDTLIITDFTQPDNGRVTRGPNGTLIYTPNPSFVGVDTFTYTISDGNGGTDTATETVTVVGIPTPTNNNPVAVNDSASTKVNEAVTLDTIANDRDADGDRLTITNVQDPANGTAVISGGQIIYTPDPGFIGTDVFTYTISDGRGGFSQAIETVIVKGSDNTKPIAVDDSVTTSLDQSVTLSTLANDSDADGDTLTITNVQDPANGTVVINGGEIIYTPNLGFIGTDRFTYTISDGNGGTAQATETVTVVGPDNRAPIANDDSRTVECNGTLSINVLGNDSDPDGDAVTVKDFTQPANGTVTRGSNGELVYTSNGENCGIDDSFTYTIVDSDGLESTATVSVSLNEEPNKLPLANNDSQTTTESQPVTLDSLGNDSDPDGDSLTITSVEDPANGTAEIVGGQILYTPNSGFIGIDRFTYTISDGNGGTATATETVTVTKTPNTAPDAKDDSGTTAFNTAKTINVLGNDTDPENDALSITGFTQGSNGTVTRGANGELIYTPNAGHTGSDTFTYTISDGNGGTDTATVTVITGEAPNTAPDAKDDSGTTPFNTAKTINVLSNDTDPENDALSIIGFTQGSNGTVTRGANGQLIYTPNAGHTGSDTFTYTISDGNGGSDTATVTVTTGEAPNKPPVAKNDSAATGCSPITINVLDNDTDPDGDALNLMSVDASNLMYGTVMQSGNQIIYKPSNTCGKGNTGVDNFSYSISDGNGGTDSANVKVTVKGITNGGGDSQANMDDAMINSGETVTLNVLANDSGKGLRIIAVDNPANGNVTFTNSTVTYTATGHGSYTETFYYDIVDANGYNDSAMIIIDVVGGCVAGSKCN